MKNEICKIKITDMNNDGCGVGRTEQNRVVFVQGGVPGDVADVKIIKEAKNYLVGKPLRLTETSPHRIENDCGAFPKCGGCVFRNVDYGYEKELKMNFIRDAFEKSGAPAFEPRPIAGAGCGRYRNKAQYPVRSGDSGMLFGYFARRTHTVVPHGDCLLQDQIFAVIARELTALFTEKKLSAYDGETGKGVLRHIYMRKNRTGDICVCAVINSDGLKSAGYIAQRLKNKFPRVKSFFLNINKEKNNVILGEKFIKILGDDYLTEQLCGKKFELSPESFFQVNTDAAEQLYNKAKEYASPVKDQIILDLYCGTGAVGIICFENGAKLCGVEIVRKAVENAKNNALLNGINEENTYFVNGDAAEGIRKCRERFGNPDIIITDPPRKGMDKELIREITCAGPKKIIYISCNPRTMARDTVILKENGYVLHELTPFDMFPRTGGVECAGLFIKST